MCYKKDGCHERWACMIWRWFHCRDVISGWVDLYMIINQAISTPNIKYIVVITDFLHVAKKIFNLSIHPYQIHSAAISQELWDFFKKDSNNHIGIWNYSSKQKWTPHFLVDKNTRKFNFSPILSRKLSWDFCKKYEYDSISMMWRMNFQASDLKGRNFLELLNNDSNPLKLSTIKGRP